MVIGKATSGDAAEILALQKLAYRSEAEICGDYSIPPLVQNLGELQAEFRTSTVFKAVDDETIIGSVRGYENNGTCYIGRLIVHPDRQNRGLGTRLMNVIETYFEEHGATRCELFTGEKSERNLYLYDKLGYRRFKTEKISELVIVVYLEKMMTSAL